MPRNHVPDHRRLRGRRVTGDRWQSDLMEGCRSENRRATVYNPSMPPGDLDDSGVASADSDLDDVGYVVVTSVVEGPYGVRRG